VRLWLRLRLLLTGTVPPPSGARAGHTIAGVLDRSGRSAAPYRTWPSGRNGTSGRPGPPPLT